MDLIWLTTPLAALASGAAMALASRRSMDRERERLAEAQRAQQNEHRAALRRAELRLEQLQGEVAQMKQICLLEGVDEADRRQRLDGRAAREILATLRGFAFLDAAVLADTSGLGYVDEPSRLEVLLGALAPPLCDARAALDALGLPLREVQIGAEDTLQISARVLPPWTGDAWLIGASTGQAPNPAALSAAVAVAHRLGERATERAPRATLGGTSRREGERGAHARAMLDEFESMASACGATALMLADASQVVLGHYKNGPEPALAQQILGAMRPAYLHLQARLHQPIESLAMTTGGLKMHLSPLGKHLHLLLLGPSLALDPLELRRFAGKVRRLHGAADAPKEAA